MSVEARKADIPSTEGHSRAHIRRGLGRTLLFWFLVLPVGALVVAGVIVSAISNQNAHQAATERLSAITTLKESEITTWVVSRQEEMALIAITPDVRSKMLYFLSAKTQDPLVVATQDRLQAYFSTIIIQRGEFEELFLLDASGRVLLSTDPSQVGSLHNRQAYFVKGQEGPYVQPPYYSLFTAAPSMVVSQPVQDDLERVWGVLVGRLSLDRLASVMREEAGLGQTGETYLVNAAGLLLTGPRFGQGLTLGQELHTEGVDRGLALGMSTSKEQVGWSIYNNYQGRRVLGVYRWIPNLEMVLLAEQEVSETLALTRGILTTGLAILLVVATAAVTTALLVSRRITRPLVSLTTTTNLIATGDLSHDVPHTDRQDEIGVLARAFNQMTEQLRDLVTGLETRVVERTRQLQEANYKLQRRAIQLEASSQVGRAITSVLSLDDLLAEIVNLIRDRFGFYHAGIFLLDDTGEWAVLRQASGEAGQRMLAKKHRLAVGGHSIVGWVIGNRQPRIALDVGTDAVHFRNPELPHTRSEMALPLVIGDRLLGTLDVQSTEEAAFDEEDVAILSLMADQVAVAIENALKFSEEATILEATSPLYRASRSIALATSLDDVLNGIVKHAAGPHVDRCVIGLYAGLTEDQEPTWLEATAVWDRASDAPSPSGTRYPLDQFKLMEHLRQEAAEPLVVNELLANGTDERIDDETYRLLAKHLQLQAALILPLVSAGRPVGLLVVACRQQHTWTETELHAFRSLSDQAATAVENARLFQRTKMARHRERQINEITNRIRRSLDMETILKTTVQELSEAIGATEAFAYLGPKGPLAPADPDQGNGHSHFD